jgi:ABC-type transporter Mla maintaining outer membrane lipid asymmetry ATPase subunit MlaF
LEDVGLLHTVNMMPSELSGGMRKRIALARALILKPSVILYDEPTTGLDPITAREISELMVSVQKKYNATSVIISHDMNCIRITSNRVIMLIDGRCYANDTYENLRLSKIPKSRSFSADYEREEKNRELQTRADGIGRLSFPHLYFVHDRKKPKYFWVFHQYCFSCRRM